MARKGLVDYFILIAVAFFGLGLIGYFLIKWFIPEATITSWWRSGEQSKALSGLSFDYHMLGLAFDICIYANGRSYVTPELFDKAKKYFPVVIVEKGNDIVSVAEADHLHVALFNKRMGVQVG